MQGRLAKMKTLNRHWKNIETSRYKKTPEVFNNEGFRIFRSLEMGLHSHYIRLNTTPNNTFSKSSLKSSLKIFVWGKKKGSKNCPFWILFWVGTVLHSHTGIQNINTYLVFLIFVHLSSSFLYLNSEAIQKMNLF